MSVLSEIPSVAQVPRQPALVAPECSVLTTIVMNLPLLHNPNRLGIRLPMSLRRFRQTFRELKSLVSGFNVSIFLGWCTEDGVWDPFLRVDFDVELTPDFERFLTWWKEVLRGRFRQRSFHMTKSSPVYWVP